MIDWSQVVQIAQFVLWAILGVYSWLTARHRATREHVERVEGSLQKFEARVGVLEERVEHLPRRDEFALMSTQVQVMIERIESLNKNLDAQVSPLRAQLDRIDTFLRRDQ